MTILLDACNLGLLWAPGCNVHSPVCPYFPDKLRLLHGSPATEAYSPRSSRAVFDGNAFHREHSEQDFGPGSGGDEIHVSFTRASSSADDAIIASVSQLCDATTPSASWTEQLSSKKAFAMLESPAHPAAMTVTLQRGTAGLGQRLQKEKFLQTMGLKNVGQTIWLLAYTQKQRERSLALLRGLRDFRDCVSCRPVNDPVAIVASDDRGLRRRAALLTSPTVVVGKMQLFNWMDALALQASEGTYIGDVSDEDREFWVNMRQKYDQDE